MKYVDTNVLIRLLVHDSPELAEKAEALVKESSFGGLIVSDAVLAETCQVLEFNPEYRFDRTIIASGIHGLLELKSFTFSRLSREAAKWYANYPKLDFVDCLLLTQKRLFGDVVVTFDKRLAKLLA